MGEASKPKKKSEKKGGGSGARSAEGRPPKYDWSSIRREYLRGDDKVTLEALSHKSGYPALGSLKNRAAAENWSELRQELRDQVMTGLAAADRDMKREVKERHLKIGNAMISMGVRGLSHLDPKQLDPIDVARFISAGTQLERKTLGMEEFTVKFGSIKTPDDLDKLNETQLWQVAALLPPGEDDDEDF